MSGYPTNDTFSSLVDEVLMQLQGFGVTNDLVASLSADIGAADVLIGVDDTSAVSKGIIEIDEEIIYVSQNAAGTLTVPSWGRGYKGTTAASHTKGAKVTVSPIYPRAIVSREVNNTIRSVYPDLFAVKTTDFPVDAVNWQYALPADMDRVLLVESRWTTQDGWLPVREWDVIHSAYATDYPTGKFIAIGEPLGANTTVHVTYAAQPSLLSNASDAFTLTGLPATARDVIVLGAASRLLPAIDLGRMPVATVMQDLVDQQKPIGNAVSLGKEMQNRYLTRLQKERAALLARYPLKSRKVR